MSASTIESGKFKVQTVGPEKSIPNKKDPSRPWKSWDLQFEGDASWYNTFWVEDIPPVVGQELEGDKQDDEKFGLQFKKKWDKGAGNKSTWNPNAANANVMEAAVHLVHGFLSLDPEHLAVWKQKRGKDQDAVSHYVATIFAIADQLKAQVVKMGGQNEAQTAATPPSKPTDGDPGPVAPGTENWGDSGDEPVALPPM